MLKKSRKRFALPTERELQIANHLGELLNLQAAAYDAHCEAKGTNLNENTRALADITARVAGERANTIRDIYTKISGGRYLDGGVIVASHMELARAG